MKFQIVLFFQLIASIATAQMTSQILLKKTMQHHDPQGNWTRFHQSIHFRISIPNQADTFSIVELDNRRRYFKYIAYDGKRRVEKGFNDQTYFATIDGKTTKSADEIKRFRLNREKVSELRDFFTYLLGMPMRLTDNGAQLSPKIRRETFNGVDCWVLRVDYAPSVGEESWLYYIDQKNFAMRGSRFMRNGNPKNGAYMVFEGETTVQNINLPTTRHWFWNEDDHFLASEIMESARNLNDVLVTTARKF